MSIAKINAPAGDMAERDASMLVGEDGAVVEISSSAARLESDGLFMSAGFLRARHHASDQRLQRAIRSTLDGNTPTQKVAVERAHGRTLLVIVTPIADQSAQARRARAVVTVVDPDRRIQADPDLLRAMFGLTTSEARVAGAIAAGSELRAISASLQITFETTRQYLKSVFLKTGTHRQAELAALLSALQVR
jgi:DNA-binding CsgD family transcriptional regulator